MKLYVKIEKKPRYIKDFIKWFFESRRYGCQYTYKNYECNQPHCISLQRSIIDLYNVCKTYYSSLTKKRFFTILKKYLLSSNVTGRYCGDRQGFVFYNSVIRLESHGRDIKYPFLIKLNSVPHNNLNKMKVKGFREPEYNLENLTKLLK